LNNSTLFTQCNSLPIVPYRSNIIEVKQSASQVQLYINKSLQFAYTNPEFNPVSGTFQIACSSSNVPVSNLIDDIDILPVFTVSNAGEFLQPTILTDVKVSASLSAHTVAVSNLTLTGNLTSGQISSLSNQMQGLASSVSSNNTSINNLQTQSSWTSNQVVASLLNTSNFLNDIYPRYVFTSNQSVSAQTMANFCSNLIPTFMTSNVFYPLRVYNSNTATYSSNQITTLVTTSGLAAYSNFVTSNFS
jgi:hypothetical protein